MTGYAIASLGPCGWDQVVDRSGSVTGWCWGGHDGLMASDDPPDTIVPTGWLWAWGEGRWLCWRVDPVAECVGAELRSGAAPAWFEPAEVVDLPQGSMVGLRTESHMLQWAHQARAVSGLTAIRVVDPTTVTFLSLTWPGRP